MKYVLPAQRKQPFRRFFFRKILQRELVVCWLVFQFILTANAYSSAEKQNPPFFKYPQFALLPQTVEIPELMPGRSVTKTITGAESHFYKVKLNAGQALVVSVEQRGVDVELIIRAPDNGLLGTADSPTSSWGKEEILVIARQSGDHKLEIKPYEADASKGSYQAEIKTLRTATAEDIKKYEGFQILSEADGIRSKGDAASIQASIKKYEKAFGIFRASKDERGQALALYKIGETKYYLLANYEEALASFDRSLPLWRKLGEKTAEANIYSSTGLIYVKLDDSSRALAELEKALALIQDVGDRKQEADFVNNIGNVYFSQNQYQKALDYFSRALAIFREFENPGEALVLLNIGTCHTELGDFQKALDSLSKSLPLLRFLDNKEDEGNALITNGTIYYLLGEYQKALDSYTSAVSIFQTLGHRTKQAHVLNDIGKTYLLLNKTDKSREYFEKALAAANASGDKKVKAYILNNIGLIHLREGNEARALAQSETALSLSREVKDRHGEAQTLNNIGRILLALSKHQNAIEHFNNALTINRETGERAEEANTLSHLMAGFQKLGSARLAIFYGKQSINRYQELRQNIQGLDKATQKTYLETVKPAYRALADLLIEQGHFAQAERVLAMLKEEEYFDFVRRGSNEIKNLKERVPLNEKEEQLIKRYSLLADRITEIGQEFIKLDDKKRRLSRRDLALSAEEQRRYEELEKQLDTANAAFRLFLTKELAAEIGAEKKKRIEYDRNLQGRLRKWGAGTVALYTVAGADRYRVILTTPKVQISGKTEIRAADLNKKVFAFRRALQNPNLDPRPLGKELYDILIKPIEKELKQAEARTLVWSLDGTLRYIPLAALSPDGQRYLVEDVQNVIITPKTRDDLSVSDPDWQALGLGVSTAQTVADPDDAARQIAFGRLPGTRSELLAIVRDEKNENEKGVLPGRRFLDGDFTTAALKDSLASETEDGKRRYNVVHIASHFNLGSNWSNSFLLLGDGKILTLEDINDSSTIEFSDVELVTLSACDTAFADDADGKEIDSLASVIQTKSGKAVLATLWKVFDESTAHLMSEFYRLRKEDPRMTKAEAIQRAQQALIRGGFKVDENNEKRGVGAVQIGSKEPFPRFVTESGRPFAHPYYWSPFVLIGNWK